MKRDPYKYFRIEAKELLDQLTTGVLALEAGASVDFAALMRAAHTLKGAARIVKQKETADLAHAFEDRMGPYRDGARRPAADDLKAALETLDAIGVELKNLPAADVGASAPQATARQKAARTIRVDVGEVDTLLGSLEALQTELSATRGTTADAEKARRLTQRLSAEVSPLRGTAVRAADSGAAFMRIRQLADELHQLTTGMERRLGRSVDRLGAGVSDIREKSERLRLVPADTLSTDLQRLARDTATSVGKRVTFEFRSTAIRLDGDVLDAAQPALVQAVINAIVHGIEAPDVRAKAGKPANGSVVVEVQRVGTRVAFRCRDDGAGVDVAAVRRAMEQKGSPAASGDVLQTMLSAGISTAKSVSGYAGRGVGLGVVREVAERLGGTPSVQSAAGAGTTVEILVPVSLFGIEVLVLEYAGGRAAVPLESVRGVQRHSRDEMITTPHGPAIDVNGTHVRVIPLGRVLGTPPPAVHERAAAPTLSSVLVTDGESLTAVGVDRVIGVQSIVQRALPPFATAERAVSGVYIDVDGRPRAILDARSLASISTPERRHERDAPRMKPILIVDDSLTTRMLERSILESAGYEVALATSGEEGLEMARAGHYGLILVDVEMPGMDGFTFVAQCRADPALRDMPCVLVTSLDAPEHRARGLAAGANAYVVKTVFDQNDFLDRVRELIRR